MGCLPENRKFILNLEFAEEIPQYPGFYRYVCRHMAYSENLVYELQMNDAREIVKLRALKSCKEIRIVGLDDILCYDSYEKILEEMIHCLPKSTIILCPENTYGCASALAMQWAGEFGRDITASFAGCRNNAATEELIMALRLAIRYKPNRDLTVFPELTRLYEAFTDRVVGNKKPIIGKNIFKVEAGIHVDGIKKNPATYEAYYPGMVGGRTELVIGKHSGSRALKLKLEELGIPFLEDSILEKLLAKVKSICTQARRSLTEEEFVKLVKEVAVDEGSQVYCGYDFAGWGTESGNCTSKGR
jgi:homocitrate synthase NifV